MGRSGLKILLAALAVSALCMIRTGVKGQAFDRLVKPLTVHSDRGPNRMHFSHLFMGISVTPPGRNTSGQSPVFTSPAFHAGIRYKYKLSPRLALGGDAGWAWCYYRINPDGFFLNQDSSLYPKPRLAVSGPQVALFLRYRLGQRGNYLGRYLDVGIQGHTPVQTLLISEETSGNSSGLGILTEKKRIERLDCMLPVNGTAFVRLGLDRVALIASCRLTRLTDGSLCNDLPVLQVGAEIALVRY